MPILHKVTIFLDIKATSVRVIFQWQGKQLIKYVLEGCVETKAARPVASLAAVSVMTYCVCFLAD